MTNPNNTVLDFSPYLSAPGWSSDLRLHSEVLPHTSSSPIAPPRTRDNSTQTSLLSIKAPSFVPSRLSPQPIPAALSAEAKPFIPPAILSAEAKPFILPATQSDDERKTCSEKTLNVRCNQEELMTVVMEQLDSVLARSGNRFSKKTLIQCYQQVANFLHVKPTGDYNLIKKLISKGIICALQEQCLIQVPGTTSDDV